MYRINEKLWSTICDWCHFSSEWLWDWGTHTQLSPEATQKCVQETRWKSIVVDVRMQEEKEDEDEKEEHVHCCGDALKLNDNGYDGPLSLVYVIPSLARIVFHCTIVRELNWISEYDVYCACVRPLWRGYCSRPWWRWCQRWRCCCCCCYSIGTSATHHCSKWIFAYPQFFQRTIFSVWLFAIFRCSLFFFSDSMEMGSADCGCGSPNREGERREKRCPKKVVKQIDGKRTNERDTGAITMRWQNGAAGLCYTLWVLLQQSK